MKIIIKISDQGILKKCFLCIIVIIALMGQVIEAESSSLLINLDPENIGGTGPDYTTTYTEGDLPVKITAPDAAIEDNEGIGINYLTVTITNPKPGDTLTADTGGTNIVFQYDQHSLTLTGMNPGGLDSAEQYQQVLQTIRFNNPGTNPDTSQRVIEFTAFSEQSPDNTASNTVRCILTIVAVNSSPVNTIPGVQMTPKNVVLLFDSNNGNRISVSDEEAEAGEIQVSLSVDRGSLSLTGDSGSLISGNNTAAIVITGTISQVNSELNGLRYEPEPDWFGKVYLNVETNDLGYSGIPGPLTDLDIIEITVGVTTGSNQAPVANAGEDLIVEEYQQVSLNGSDSSDPDGEITNYEWEQTDGLQVALSGADTPIASFTAPAFEEGNDILRFQLKITDDKGDQSTDSIDVSLTRQNEPDAVFNEGETVILDTSDSIGEMAAYEWSQISGPGIFLSDSTIASPSFVAPIVNSQGAELVFELNSENQEGIKFSTRIIIQINDNGIIGFPEDVLTFRPTTTTEMGIKIIEGELVSIKGISPDDVAVTENRPEDLIYGLINMQVRVSNTTQEAIAEMYFPDPVDNAFKWFGFHEDSGWSDYGNNSVFSEDKRHVTLYLTDYPNVIIPENGIISDTSGLGKPSSIIESGAGDSDGGCFIIVSDLKNNLNHFFKKAH